MMEAALLLRVLRVSKDQNLDLGSGADKIEELLAELRGWREHLELVVTKHDEKRLAE